MMILSALVAADENNGIGGNNDLLWNLPDDMRFFKTITMGHVVIMGRKTLESLRKPLKNRENICITRSKSYKPEGVHVVHSLEEALALAKTMEKEEAFLLGGGEIFKQGLHFCDRLYLTRVHASYAADTFFPEVIPSDWKEVAREEHPADERHAVPFTFLTYDRIWKL